MIFVVATTGQGDEPDNMKVWIMQLGINILIALVWCSQPFLSTLGLSSIKYRNVQMYCGLC